MDGQTAYAMYVKQSVPMCRRSYVWTGPLTHSLTQAHRKATGQAGRHHQCTRRIAPTRCTHKPITHTTHHRYCMQHEADRPWNGIKRAHVREGISEVTRASPSHPSLTHSLTHIVSSSQCLQSTPPSIHPPARPATYLGTYTAGHTHGTYDTKTTSLPCPAPPCPG